MTPERQKLVEEIFLVALELKPELRRAVIKDRCGSDIELRREVEDLLGCHDADSGVLDRPSPVGQSLLMGLTSSVPLSQVPLPPGGKVGHYRITGVLGAGGMGAVYVAEQDRPRRTVALKVIRPGYASAQLLRRMEHEAELLGRLQHPGIAQIYEAGTADYGNGPQPFFAMELVNGPHITAFCETNKLSTRERLALMLDVCAAVEHAHQRGVIHRDLKPANILINESRQTKILDFGVARATSSDMYATTLQTSVGQLIGTLPYMSPEQVSARPEDIDTRTDVYALGVMMYEVLTGKLPHDLTDRSIPEAARVIRDEPPVRLSTINRHLRGDVETIIAKAMEKDKLRRYQSAAALAEDVRRFLHNEPIAAKRDSAMYVFRKQLRRRPGIAILTAALLIALVFFAIYATIQASNFRELADRESTANQLQQRARELAEREKLDKELANRQLAEQLDRSLIERGRLEGLADNPAAAEAFLWPQLFKRPSNDGAWWGLWELYARYPSRWAGRPVTSIGSLAPLEGGNRLIVGTRRGTVAVISAHDGQLVAESKPFLVDNKPVAVTAVVGLSATRAVSIFADGNAVVWSIGDKEILRDAAFKAVARGVDGVLVALDENTFIAGSFDGNVHVCSTAAGSVAREWKAHARNLTAMALSSDKRTLATGGADTMVRLWDLKSGKMISEFNHAIQGPSSMVFAPDGHSIYVGGDNRALAEWTLEPTPKRVQLVDVRGDARALALVDGGKTIVVVGSQCLRAHSSAAISTWRSFGFDTANFHRGVMVQNRFVTLSADGTLRDWETSSLPFAKRLQGHTNWVFGADFSPDSKHFASVGGEGALALWDLGSDTPTKKLFVDPLLAIANRPQISRTRSVRYSPDGQQIVTGSQDGSLRCYSSNGEQLLGVIKSTGEVYGVAFSPDGSTIASAHGDRAVRFWDAKSRKPLGEVPKLATIPRTVVYSPDGKLVYSGGINKTVVAWNATTFAKAATYTLDAEPWAIALSPDGRYLAVGTFEALIEIFDLKTGKRLSGRSGHRIVIAGLVFSPDSKVLISGGDDGSVKFWEPSTGRVLGSFEFGKGEVPYVAISPDGKTLAATCQAGVVAVCDLTYHNTHMLGNLALAAARYADKSLAKSILEDIKRRASGEAIAAPDPQPTQPESPVNATPSEPTAKPMSSSSPVAAPPVAGPSGR